jgi:hypothetical protein
MKEILEFRTQKFIPKLPEKLNQFSGIEVLNFDEEDIELPKILILYELKSEEIFDRNLISQLIKDVFHDYFFRKESHSNIQIAEEAILDIKHKLIKILKSSDKNKLDLNLISGIFYDNNLSIIKYGKTFASIVRDGNFDDLEFAVEGYFGNAKGNVKNSDVLIFSTNEFHKNYINQNLISNGLKIDDSSLDPLESSLVFMFYKSINQDRKKLIDQKSKKLISKTKRIFKKNYKLVLFSLLLICGLSGYSFYKTYQQSIILKENESLIQQVDNLLLQDLGLDTKQANENILNQIELVNNSSLMNKEEYVDKLKQKYNQVNKIKNVSYKILSDFKEQNPRINLVSFLLLNDNIYILDKDTSKIYTSKFSEIKFDSTEMNIKGLKSLDSFTKTILMGDETNFHFYTLDLNKNPEVINLDSIGISKVYMGFIYELKENKVYRIDANEDSPKRELWAENNLLENAIDISIDFDIFVLDKNSQLLRFSKGINQKINFENDRFEFSKMYINSDIKNNYFISENKIVEYSKDGKLLNVYSDPSFNEKINDFVVLKNNKIILISNSKLAELQL